MNVRLLMPNPDWAKLPLFDRKRWTRLPFGAFAESVNERVEPANAADEIYVGLDDLDPGNLHIPRWGKGSDVIGTKLRFRKGDIIFGRRRAYQRKLAVAEFDGICSAHAMVVRAKPDLVLPEFLPFLMMSDHFMKRAVEISVGSLSPTINWTTLKLETFDLAPLTQQRHLAEVFASVDAVEQSYRLTSDALREIRGARIEEQFEQQIEVKPLVDLGNVSYGITLGGHRASLPIERPYLRVANVGRERLDLNEIKIVKCTEVEASQFALNYGDVLIVEGHASVEDIGRVAVWNSDRSGMLHQNHLIRVRCGSTLVPNYLSLYANSVKGRAYFRSRAKSSSGLNTINSTVVKELPVPVPNKAQQTQLVRQVQRIDGSLAAVADSQIHLRRTLTEFLNAIVQ